MRASPSGKASAFQADIRRFESGRPLLRNHAKRCGFLFNTAFDGNPAAASLRQTLRMGQGLIEWVRGPVAQWLEQPAHNRSVAGSNPAGPTFHPRFPFGIALWRLADVGGANLSQSWVDILERMQGMDPHSYTDQSQGKIKHLTLHFSVDFTEQILNCRGEYRFDGPVTGPLFLDTRALDIQQVRCVAGDLSWSVDQEDKVKGERLHIEHVPGVDRIEIMFRTSAGASALQWLQPEQTVGGEYPFLYSQCQSLHARSIFPCQDTPSVRFTYDAEIDVPAPLRAVMAAAPGDLRQEEARNHFRFTMPQAIPSYLFAFAVGNLESKDIGPRSRIYAEPESLEAAAWEFAQVEPMIHEAETLYGPYVWDRFDMLLMPPAFPYGGMENPRLTFLTPTIIAGDRSLTSVVVHELAHSWTGNLVTNATWEDFWLNEGWTVYAERRILEKLHGRDASELASVIGRNNMFTDMKVFGMDAAPTCLKFSQQGKHPDEVMSRVAYEKGYSFLVALERAVGRAAFDPFILGYIKEFQFQSLTTEAFIAYLTDKLPEAVEKVDVETWLYKPGFPDDAPAFSSRLLEDVQKAVEAYKAGDLPDPGRMEAWAPDQKELFLQLLPPSIPVEDCEAMLDLLSLETSQNTQLLTAYMLTAIRSGYEAVLPDVEELLTHVGRGLFVRALYRALANSAWSREQARPLFERLKSRYHPIVQVGTERVLAAAGV